MKSEFNKSWNRSVQPRKQRKFVANAPNHIRQRFMGCNLDKELREKHGFRTAVLRKGDTVKIMRGNFKGKQGKVGVVDIGNCRIQVDGVQRMKRSGGEKVETWFHPSSVKIIILDMEDSKRFKRKDGSATKGKKKMTKEEDGSR